MSDEPIESAAVYDLLCDAFSGDPLFTQYVSAHMGDNEQISDAEIAVLEWLADEVQSQIATLDEAVPVARMWMQGDGE